MARGRTSLEVMEASTCGWARSWVIGAIPGMLLEDGEGSNQTREGGRFFVERL